MVLGTRIAWSDDFDNRGIWHLRWMLMRVTTNIFCLRTPLLSRTITTNSGMLTTLGVTLKSRETKASEPGQKTSRQVFVEPFACA